MQPAGENAARTVGDRRRRVMAGAEDITGHRRPGAGMVIATAGVVTAAGAGIAGVIAIATGKMKNTAAFSGGVSLDARLGAQSARREPEAGDDRQQRR